MGEKMQYLKAIASFKNNASLDLFLIDYQLFK